MNDHYIIIATSLIIIVSYSFNVVSKRTGIPSVLMLIFLGFGLKSLVDLFGLPTYDFSKYLGILGTAGLILIVLEAALDLELKREKKRLIAKAFLVGLLGVFSNAFLLAFAVKYIIGGLDFWVALAYAIPLSIMSSAIIIPSVANLPHNKKEFMIYESTFSDIIGIMFFYAVVENLETETATEIGVSISGSIFITIIVSIIVSYLILFIFQKLKSEIKLFLLISVLMLFYAIGKVFHLSTLLLILIFGLILRNRELFIRGFLKKHISKEALSEAFTDFNTITLESSFLLRTFFFVVFGASITLSSILELRVWFVSALALIILYGSRFLLLRTIIGSNIKPMLYLSPRGLISILLFFSIPEQYAVADFGTGILLFMIIATSLIMAWALVFDKKRNPNKQSTPPPKVANEGERKIESESATL